MYSASMVKSEMKLIDYFKLDCVNGKSYSDCKEDTGSVNLPKIVCVDGNQLTILACSKEIVTKDGRIGIVFHLDNFPNISVRYYNHKYKTLSHFSRVHVSDISVIL